MEPQTFSERHSNAVLHLRDVSSNLSCGRIETGAARSAEEKKLASQPKVHGRRPDLLSVK